MTESEERTKRQIEWTSVLIASILGISGGTAAPFVAGKIAPQAIEDVARPDPFTGAEGRALGERVDKTEERITRIERLVEAHAVEMRYIVKMLEEMRQSLREISRELHDHEERRGGLTGGTHDV